MGLISKMGLDNSLGLILHSYSVAAEQAKQPSSQGHFLIPLKSLHYSRWSDFFAFVGQHRDATNNNKMCPGRELCTARRQNAASTFGGRILPPAQNRKVSERFGSKDWNRRTIDAPSNRRTKAWRWDTICPYWHPLRVVVQPTPSRGSRLPQAGSLALSWRMTLDSVWKQSLILSFGCSCSALPNTGRRGPSLVMHRYKGM